MRHLKITSILRRLLLNSLMFIPILFFEVKAQDLDSLLDLNLETVLDIQTKGRGDVGSFGYRLSDKDAVTTIHGYVTNEYIDADESVGTFDNHYFNVFVGTRVGEKIYAEIQLEYEHGGADIDARYAQLDYKVSDALIFRTGKFLVPINTFNEYLYPEYINKTISRPYHNRQITPTAWGEVGAQVRGNMGSDDFKFNYALFVVNGLQGAEGEDIREMRGNVRDKKNDNKAIGGKVGFAANGIEFGAGIYNGVYTEDGEHKITIGAVDLAYTNENITARAEYNFSNQEVTDNKLKRNGGSLMVAYIFADRWEPVLRYDFINYDDLDKVDAFGAYANNGDSPPLDLTRFYVGMNYRISNTMNFKVGYEFVTNEGEDLDDNVISFQLALGF